MLLVSFFFFFFFFFFFSTALVFKWECCLKQTHISPTRERKRAFVIGKKSIGTPENKVKVKVSSGFVIGPYFFNLFFNIFNFPLFFWRNEIYIERVGSLHSTILANIIELGTRHSVPFYFCFFFALLIPALCLLCLFCKI